MSQPSQNTAIATPDGGVLRLPSWIGARRWIRCAGGHHIRTAPRAVGRCACRMAVFPSPIRTCWPAGSRQPGLPGEYPGLREDRGDGSAQTTPRGLNPPRDEIPRCTRASRRPQAPAPPGNDPAATPPAPVHLPARPGSGCPPSVTRELDRGLDGQLPRGPDIFGSGTGDWSGPKP
jgi:hypothetical protein